MATKTRCNGQWTESRYRNFIISMLRRGSGSWAPKQEVKKAARVSRGIYECAGCGQEVTASVKVDGKRVSNVFVDHINPVVDPSVGFTTWDEYIERMFCEADNLQLLCKSCHDSKTKQERQIATERKKKEKQ